MAEHTYLQQVGVLQVFYQNCRPGQREITPYLHPSASNLKIADYRYRPMVCTLCCIGNAQGLCKEDEGRHRKRQGLCNVPSIEPEWQQSMIAYLKMNFTNTGTQREQQTHNEAAANG
jgi:hypothetical protein